MRFKSSESLTAQLAQQAPQKRTQGTLPCLHLLPPLHSLSPASRRPNGTVEGLKSHLDLRSAPSATPRGRSRQPVAAAQHRPVRSVVHVGPAHDSPTSMARRGGGGPWWRDGTAPNDSRGGNEVRVRRSGQLRDRSGSLVVGGHRTGRSR